MTDNIITQKFKSGNEWINLIPKRAKGIYTDKAIGSATQPVQVNASGDVVAGSALLPLTGGTISGNLAVTGNLSMSNGSLSIGSSSHPGVLHLWGPTDNSPAYDETAVNAKIIFGNQAPNQQVSLVYTDYDTYQKPASISLVGQQGGEYFIAPNIKATTKFFGNVSGNASTADLAKHAKGIIPVKGTGTTAGTWLATCDQITEYYDGLTIAYYVNVAGAATTTLNINSLGAVTVRRDAGNLTTHLPVGTVVILTYSTMSGTAYWHWADYDANNNDFDRYFDRRNRPYAGAGGVYRYTLWMKGADGRAYNLSTGGGTGATKPVQTALLYPDQIWYYAANNDKTEGNPLDEYSYRSLWFNAGQGIRTFNAAVPAYSDIYLCGTIDPTTGMFKLATTSASGAANTLNFYMFATTNSDTRTYSPALRVGYTYIYVGSSNATPDQWQLSPDHPRYISDGSKLIPYNAHRSATVGHSGNTLTNKWYKFASFTQSGTNSDVHVTFHVWSGYADNSTKLGTLTAHHRTNGYGWENGQLAWETAISGITPTNFVMLHTAAGASGATKFPAECELWAYCDVSWQQYHFEVISEGDRTTCKPVWTLYNNITDSAIAGEVASAYTSTLVKIDSALATIKNNTSGYAATATKLGTATIGGTTTPIYLNAGVPTAGTALGTAAYKAVGDFLPTRPAYIEFQPLANNSGWGGYLDFHYNQSTADYTSRIIENASGKLNINGSEFQTTGVKLVGTTTGTFSGNLTGNVTGNVSGSSGSCTGNSATATNVPWTGVTDKPTSFTPASHTHGNIANDGTIGTASRVLISDANKKVAVSSVTTTTLGYLDATSSIQTQLDDLRTDVDQKAGTGRASSTADGLMSSSDKTTLDGLAGNHAVISNGTTANTTAGHIYGVAAVTSGSYVATRWIAKLQGGVTAPHDGMMVSIKVPVAGNGTYGTVLTIDGGTTYHPVCRAVNSMISTRYAVNAVITLVYNSVQTGAAYGIAANGALSGDGKSYNVTGIWVVVNDTDNDTNTYVRQYNRNTTDTALPLLTRYRADAKATDGYDAYYAAYNPNVTLNTKTGIITATKFVTSDGTNTADVLTTSSALSTSNLSGNAISTSLIPNIDASKVTSGTLPVARGGTGASSLANVTVGVANKLGTASKGDGTTPIYLNAGAPTACTRTIPKISFADTTAGLPTSASEGDLCVVGEDKGYVPVMISGNDRYVNLPDVNMDGILRNTKGAERDVATTSDSVDQEMFYHPYNNGGTSSFINFHSKHLDEIESCIWGPYTTANQNGFRILPRLRDNSNWAPGFDVNQYWVSFGGQQIARTYNFYLSGPSGCIDFICPDATNVGFNRLVYRVQWTRVWVNADSTAYVYWPVAWTNVDYICSATLVADNTTMNNAAAGSVWLVGKGYDHTRVANDLWGGYVDLIAQGYEWI